MATKKPAPKRNFKADPRVHAKAVAAAKGAKRPNRKSKGQLKVMAQVEVFKDELLRQGYLAEVQKAMPKIMKAHLKVAAMAKVGATQERKLLFEASGIKRNKEVEDGIETIGQLLADLAAS